LIPGAGFANRGDTQAPRPGVAFDAAGLDLDLGGLGLLDTAFEWAVPAATIAGPGLLLLLLIALQSAGAMAWIPAVRRLRGTDVREA
jgi:hypothetical protein